MRCPDCNKFVGNELGDPELNLDNVTLDYDEKEKTFLPAVITGDLRLVLTCSECSNELAEANPSIEIEVELQHQESDKHEVEVKDEEASGTDRYDGKPNTPSRYRRHYYGAEVSGTVVCSCGAKASFSQTVEEQAGSFDPLN